MIDEKKIILVLILVIGGVVILSLGDTLTGFSVNEGNTKVEVFVDNVLPGVLTKAELVFSMNTDTLSDIEVIVTGESSSWISLLQDRYGILPDTETTIPLYITVPEGTAPGEYNAKIAILSVNSEDDSSLLQESILSYIPIIIRVVDEEIGEGYKLKTFVAYDTEFGEKNYFETNIENLVNTIQNEEIIIQVYNLNGEIVLESSFPTQFMALENKKIFSSFDSLEEGQYYAKIIIDGQSKKDSFEILSKGELQKEGELLAIESVTQEEKLVKVYAYYKNTGESIQSIALHGDIIKQNKLVETFNTEEQIIPPGETKEFIYTYSRTLNGAYTLEAQFVENNIVLAQGETEFYSSNAITLESNIIVIISLIMLLLIVSHFMLSRRKT